MITIARIELLLAVLGGLVFLGLYRTPWRRSNRRMAWHIFSLAGAMVTEAVVLFLVTINVIVPAWVVLVAFGLIDVVVVWRLWLLLYGGIDNDHPGPPTNPS